MSEFSCVIQASSAADGLRDQLRDRLAAHHVSHYPGEDVRVSFRAVDAGYMFTEGRRSTTSVVSCVVAHETTRDQRETYMRGVCDLWSDVTGCTTHEILVSLNDAPPAVPTES